MSSLTSVVCSFYNHTCWRWPVNKPFYRKGSCRATYRKALVKIDFYRFFQLFFHLGFHFIGGFGFINWKSITLPFSYGGCPGHYPSNHYLLLFHNLLKYIGSIILIFNFNLLAFINVFSPNSFSYRGSHFKLGGEGSQIVWIRCRTVYHTGSCWRCRLLCVGVRVRLSHRLSLEVSFGVRRGQGSQIQDRAVTQGVIEAVIWCVYGWRFSGLLF